MMRSSTGIKRIITGLILGGLLAVLSMGVMSEPATVGVVTPGSKAASSEACVAPTEEMRRNHMDYLKHDRIEVVYKGIRDTEFGLSSCVECHAAKDDKGGYLPINGKGQFCDSCHEYVAVSLPCFQCHRKTPAEQGASGDSAMTGSNPHRLGLLQSGGGQLTLSAVELRRLHVMTLEK
jgi:hypothetical protein